MIPRARKPASLWTLVLALVLGAPAGAPASLSAQGFSLRLGRGEIGLTGAGTNHAQGPAAGEGTSDFQQWVRIPVSGTIIHPRVWRYALSVRPVFGQHSATTLDRPTSDRRLGLDFTSVWFPRRRVTLTLQMIRASGVTQGAFGTRLEFNNAQTTWTAFVRDRYFPVTITYTRRRVSDAWSSAYTAGLVERDQDDRRLRVEVRNRKLYTLLERASYSDLRGQQDHSSLTAQFHHRVEWGMGSSLMSTLVFHDRDGSGSIYRTNWSERVHLQHTTSVASSISFARQTWRRNGRDGRNLAAALRTGYDSGSGFRGDVQLSAQNFSSTLGTGSARYRVEPTLRYEARLPWGATWNTRATIGAERFTQKLTADAWLDVIDEEHEVDETRRFFLEQLRVDRESVEIWDARRVLRLEEGIDYWLVETATFLEVQIPPGSRVREGETVLVSYRYQPLAKEGSTLLYVNYETSVRWDGLTLRHGRRQRTDDGAGQVGAAVVTSDSEVWYGVGFSRRTRVGTLIAELSRRSRSAEEIRYTQNEARVQLGLPSIAGLDSRLRGAYSRTRTDVETTVSSTYGVSLGWRVSPRLRITAAVDGWSWSRNGDHVERFFTGMGQLNWSIGRTDLTLSFDQVRRWNGVSRLENRWSIRLVRRF
ncbi:MAG: hypothetical protein ACE5GJ_07505 [Gemmatimonadota bacterium]